MFKYKVNTRVLAPLRVIAKNGSKQALDLDQEADRLYRALMSLDEPDHNQPSLPNQPEIPVEDEADDEEEPLTKYPILRINPTITRKNTVKVKRLKTFRRKASTQDTESQTEASLQVKVLLDFGYFFGWLERFIWVTLALGIAWALIVDFDTATQEVCVSDSGKERLPFNILPSLSRTMSSFRVGTFLWTLSMAAAFMARLMSNYFLHRLYRTWYDDNTFNKIFLFIAYHSDNLEIVSLLMIPAYSLDCDHEAHSMFFIAFLGLTYLAELLQYFTKFLKRKKDLGAFSEDVPNYYKHIGILILLQTMFIFWMFAGYLLHTYLCQNFLYSLFSFGEYMTVVINIRFKRDTVLFVK